MDIICPVEFNSNRLDKTELMASLENAEVLGKLTPNQKQRLVSGCQACLKA
jgi:magnesium-transporting ATPase (P-type)